MEYLYLYLKILHFQQIKKITNSTLNYKCFMLEFRENVFIRRVGGFVRL